MLPGGVRSVAKTGLEGAIRPTRELIANPEVPAIFEGPFEHGGVVVAKLEYPLFFMDFETINSAIPRLAGMRPFDHLPFEWSVHVQREPGAEPEHHKFLAEDASDPLPVFISSLCDALGEKGNVVVYNQQFESSRLRELAAWLPESAGRIEGIQRRLFDLLPVVRNHVYHPAFGGSYSLKAVLPALVPEMTYEGMEVADGQAAGLGRRWSTGACLKLSAMARGGRCWSIAGRIRWRWPE
jgi:hypothetical protein